MIGLGAVETRRIPHHVVALELRRLDDRLPDVWATGDRLLEARQGTTE